MTTAEIEWMNVTDLAFDLKNPRLSEHDLGVAPEDSDVVRFLWEAMDVRELVMSIAASGYFSHDPIIVVHENDKNVVIEGNRRLAAVKLLLDPGLAKNLKLDVTPITEEARRHLRELPVLHDTRENAWHYYGFKHVNGPAKWSSYAKSRYIADVHRKYGIPLESIAEHLGDTHKAVQRLFRSLMVIEQAVRVGGD